MKPTPSTPPTGTVIRLAAHLEQRLMGVERRMPMPSLHNEVAGLKLSATLHQMFSNMITVAEATRRGKARPDAACVSLWRIAECIRDSAYDAAALERKLKKAKKKARR